MSSPPPDILTNARLQAARKEVNTEINRCARNRPWFSGDGRVALVRITSGAQIHPVSLHSSPILPVLVVLIPPPLGDRDALDVEPVFARIRPHA